MMDNFWKSENNKRKLINATYKYYIDNLGTCAFNVVCSGYIDQNGDIYPAMHCSGTHVRALIELQEYSQHAEADMRIILHIYWALCESLDSIIILSNDTDVLVLILRYVFYFLSIGLKHLFIRIGNANNMRYLPLH